jgi:pyruvate dehydrogenase E1 component
MYRVRPSENKDANVPRAQLLGSGAILWEVLKAQQLLQEKYGVAADVWSVTSYKELYKDGITCERWNLLHPDDKQQHVPFVTQSLKDAPGPIVAASDYVKTLPLSISRWCPRPIVALGTDGFGRSETRAALRDFFEVDARFVTLATLNALAKDGKVKPEVVRQAIKDLEINTEKADPLYA